MLSYKVYITQVIIFRQALGYIQNFQCSSTTFIGISDIAVVWGFPPLWQIFQCGALLFFVWWFGIKPELLMCYFLQCCVSLVNFCVTQNKQLSTVEVVMMFY